ncbi:hypothetical protein [Neobacillus vireti]
MLQLAHSSDFPCLREVLTIFSILSFVSNLFIFTYNSILVHF